MTHSVGSFADIVVAVCVRKSSTPNGRHLLMVSVSLHVRSFNSIQRFRWIRSLDVCLQFSVQSYTLKHYPRDIHRTHRVLKKLKLYSDIKHCIICTLAVEYYPGFPGWYMPVFPLFCCFSSNCSFVGAISSMMHSFSYFCSLRYIYSCFESGLLKWTRRERESSGLLQ